MPLGLTQWRFWYLANLAPESAIYNLPAAFRLAGELDVGALEDALNLIIARHEILRTRVALRDYEPVQEILPSIDLRLEVIDLSELDSLQRMPELLRQIDVERAIPLPMTSAPMLKTALFKLAPDDYVLFWMPHHVIWDGWSFDIFLAELAQLYGELETGGTAKLDPLPIQYVDYACWHRNLVESDGIDQQLEYWRTQLSGELPVLELPTDRPRPEMMSFDGARSQLGLNAETMKQLNNMAREEGATMFMVLLAGLYAVLHRYTGQRDLIVGSPVQSRINGDVEQLIGVFVNTLVLRVKLTPDMTFRELLRAVKQCCVASYDYQDTPFETLVDEFETERTLSRNPLYQVLFSYQDVTNRDPNVGSLGLSQIHIETSVAPTDLTVWVMETGAGLEGGIDYATDLFDAATIEALISHYTYLMESAAFESSASIGALAMVPEAEQKELMSQASGKRMSIPSDSVDALIAKAAEAYPDNVAVRCDDQTVSYEELIARSSHLASSLKARGIGPKDRVGICLQRGINLIPLLLAVFRSGAAYVPLDPGFPRMRIEHMVGDAGLKLIVTEAEVRGALPSGNETEICLLSELLDEKSGSGACEPVALAQTSSLAYTIYTSGSTGKPKGVEIPHAAIVNLLLSMADELQIEPSDSLLAVTTLSFDISVLELFLPLTQGASVVLADIATTQDAANLRKLLEQSAPTIMQATPASWRMLKDASWQGDANLTVLCGGEEMPRDLAKWLVHCNRRVANVYGPTETTVWSSIHWVAQDEQGKSAIPIGRPIANTQLFILDDRFNLVPPLVQGDLYIGGLGLALGYRNLADMTAERFLTVSLLGEEMRVYKTGDRASRRRDGSIDFHGRSDLQVKVRGFRIELGDVETAMLELEEIREAAAVVQSTQNSEARLVAYIVFDNDADITTSELRKALRKSLPDYMVPSIFTELKELPKTPNGKVDRQALPDSTQNTLASGQDFREAKSEEERTISEIWRGLLDIDNISMNDNFFDLGGFSLLAMRCVARVEEKTGVRLNPRELFFRSAGQLAELMK